MYTCIIQEWNIFLFKRIMFQHINMEHDQIITIKQKPHGTEINDERIRVTFTDFSRQ